MVYIYSAYTADQADFPKSYDRIWCDRLVGASSFNSWDFYSPLIRSWLKRCAGLFTTRTMIRFAILLLTKVRLLFLSKAAEEGRDSTGKSSSPIHN
jgi:hypothetical protein